MKPSILTRVGGVLVFVVLGGSIAGILSQGGGGGGGGDVVVPSPPAATKNVANLWVDSSGGTCTRQGIAGAYSDPGACSNVEKAVKAAQKGDTIRIKGGTYPPQMILNATPATPSNGKLLPAIVRPSQGESVTIGDGTSMNANGVAGNTSGTPCKGGATTSYFYALCLQGTTSWIELRDLNFYKETTPGPLSAGTETPNNVPPHTDTGRGAIALTDNGGAGALVSHINLRNLNATSLRIDGKVSYVNVYGGIFGGISASNPEANGATTPLNITSGQARTDLPTNIAIDGAIFQNDNSDVAGDHIECALVNGVQYFTLSRSILRECTRLGHSTADINVNVDLGATSDVWLINNFFASVEPGGFYTLNIGLDVPRVHLLNNSWDGALGVNYAPSCVNACAGWEVKGNYGAKSTCPAGVTFAHNVFRGGTCSPTDSAVSTLDFTDGGSGVGHNDLHLTSSANALGRVPQADCQAVDIDNTRRPTTGNCDAGADER